MLFISYWVLCKKKPHFQLAVMILTVVVVMMMMTKLLMLAMLDTLDPSLCAQRGHKARKFTPMLYVRLYGGAPPAGHEGITQDEGGNRRCRHSSTAWRKAPEGRALD
eukprot:1143164-Pelagomonas_calceolata.AAC.2